MHTARSVAVLLAQADEGNRDAVDVAGIKMPAEIIELDAREGGSSRACYRCGR